MSNWRGRDFFRFFLLLSLMALATAAGLFWLAVIWAGLALLTLAEMVLHVIADSMKDEGKAG